MPINVAMQLNGAHGATRPTSTVKGLQQEFRGTLAGSLVWLSRKSLRETRRIHFAYATAERQASGIANQESGAAPEIPGDTSWFRVDRKRRCYPGAGGFDDTAVTCIPPYERRGSRVCVQDETLRSRPAQEV